MWETVCRCGAVPSGGRQPCVPTARGHPVSAPRFGTVVRPHRVPLGPWLFPGPQDTFGALAASTSLPLRSCCSLGPDHEAGPLVPAERLAQRARAPLRVTRPGHGGPACLLAHFRSALQALKKDDGVPWTGMLAIVHSYVTHKTGRTSSGSRRGHPCLQAHPRGARRRLFWAPTLRRGTVGLVLAARPLRRRGGVLGLVHLVGATGSHEQVRLERLRHRPRRLPAPPAPHSPTAADLALSFPVKEEEKQKLLQRGSELQSEHQQLEERDRRLASAVKVRGGGARRGRGEAVVGAAPLAPRGAGPERPHPAAEAPEEGETCPQHSGSQQVEGASLPLIRQTVIRRLSPQLCAFSAL